MLRILPIALAQVKVVNTTENLLNKIRHICSLYQVKENNKNANINVTNSIKL